MASLSCCSCTSWRACAFCRSRARFPACASRCLQRYPGARDPADFRGRGSVFRSCAVRDSQGRDRHRRCCADVYRLAVAGVDTRPAQTLLPRLRPRKLRAFASATILPAIAEETPIRVIRRFPCLSQPFREERSTGRFHIVSAATCLSQRWVESVGVSKYSKRSIIR